MRRADVHRADADQLGPAAGGEQVVRLDLDLLVATLAAHVLARDLRVELPLRRRDLVVLVEVRVLPIVSVVLIGTSVVLIAIASAASATRRAARRRSACCSMVLWMIRR